MAHTMIRRLYIDMGVVGLDSRQLWHCLRTTEKFLGIKGGRREERLELEDWRRILISLIQTRQVFALRRDRGLD